MKFTKAEKEAIHASVLKWARLLDIHEATGEVPLVERCPLCAYSETVCAFDDICVCCPVVRAFGATCSGRGAAIGGTGLDYRLDSDAPFAAFSFNVEHTFMCALLLAEIANVDTDDLGEGDSNA
jgi:hypothetical protein